MLRQLTRIERPRLKYWVNLVKGPRIQGRILVVLEYDAEDLATLRSCRVKTDIRDIYPPHNARFKHHYQHIPRSWHPDPAVRSSEGPSNIIVPQNEVLLHMIEEVTISTHINESLNTGELAVMILTNYRLWFIPYKEVVEEALEDVLSLPVGKISKAQISSQKKRSDGVSTTVMTIETMDGGTYHASLSRLSRIKDNTGNLQQEAQIKRMQELHNTIEEIEWLQAENNFACSTSQTHLPIPQDDKPPPPPTLSPSGRHHLRLLAASDYARQGALAHARWRVTTVNAQYDLCPTYPRHLLIPASISDATLWEAAKYRSKARLPVLSWLHPTSGAALCRSSQPNSGVMRADNKADTELIWAIRDATVHRDAPIEAMPASSSIVFIIDARPEINAKGNALAGKGHETSKQYERDGTRCSRVVFMGIDNIHVLRSSFATFSEAFYAVDDSAYFATIQKSRCVDKMEFGF